MSTLFNDDEDHGEVFLDEDDIEQEINVDEEDLPDANDDLDSDAEVLDEAEDSIHIFTGHTGELYTVACSPTDTWVAIGGGDDKGFLWKIGQGDWVFELQGHKDSISSVAFSYDGQLVASGSFDGVINVWDISLENLKREFEPGAGIEWVRWHPRKHVVLAGSEDSTIWMWDANTGDYLTILGHASSVTCGDFTPDGKTICSGSDDSSLRVWNSETGKKIHVVRGHHYHTQGLTCLTITADSTRVLTAAKDGYVHIVNIATGKVINSLKGHLDSIECIGLSARFPLAATGCMDKNLIIWDLQHSTHFVCEHDEGVTCLSWVGGTRFVATGCVDGRVKIWDSSSGECVNTLRGHTHVIQSIAVSFDGNHLVSVSLDGTARVFEIPDFH